jgi:hypothetical protein
MIQSVLQYVLLALGLVASLALFFSLKHEIQANTRKHRQKIEEMIARLDEAAKAAELAAPPMEVFVRAPCPGFNLNQRAQALRLLRRGEEVAHVAAALGVPRREVELLVRVQRMTSAQLTGAPR